MPHPWLPHSQLPQPKLPIAQLKKHLALFKPEQKVCHSTNKNLPSPWKTEDQGGVGDSARLMEYPKTEEHTCSNTAWTESDKALL